MPVIHHVGYWVDDLLVAAYGHVPGAVSHVSWVVPDVAEESARLAGLGSG